MTFSQNHWRPSTLGLNDECFHQNFHQNYGGPSEAGAETLFFYWKMGETVPQGSMSVREGVKVGEGRSLSLLSTQYPCLRLSGCRKNNRSSRLPYPPEKWVMLGEVELEVPLTLVCASTYTQRQWKSETALKIMLSLFCRCYLANCHHPDSHYTLCLLTGGLVQNVPEEYSRYLVCFLCRGGEINVLFINKISVLDYLNLHCCGTLMGKLFVFCVLPKVGN